MIGKYAFSRCTSLKGIKLPSTLEGISEFAFFDCKNLTEIIISDGVVYLALYAFEYSDITSITLPESVIILDYSESGLNNLTDIYYAGSKEQ